MKVFIIILVVIAIAVALIYLLAKNKSSYKIVEVECIKMEDLVAFFKEPSRSEALKKNANTIGVAIKEKIGNDTFKIICTLFDKEKNEVVDIENCTIGYKSKKLDDVLAESFGDKKMIVLG